MFTNVLENHPPVRAVIWDLDGMVIQINQSENEMSLADLESLVLFILALGQEYRMVVLSHQSEAMAVHLGSFEKLLLPLKDGRTDDYHLALHRLAVQPRQSVIVGVDPLRLTDANRMGFQTVAFHNPRQMASELLPLLAEPLPM
ncbi:hypothetical protein LARV_03115 [Longilinea arvoryzae]|uniref:Uncharacterized protein n=1 Tax=Longilinea arvoryzae TaxID=360412 RepID=A0A0S7BL32_9CHLR|nr:hypothetical protein [Longilinea arvoryzae]GAP15331.1 hypothetical protein LARV_03115 [Longilinea arvoryzae]